MDSDQIHTLSHQILARDRYALSRGITLVESARKADQTASVTLLDHCLRSGEYKRSKTIVISGSPGVGKSTFIESLGMYLIRHGHRVAVLSIDPSSPISGGSIMGDKTRMEQLSRHPSAFVRPSTDQSKSGGLNPATYETGILCASAGFDIVMIETVGVGQTEVQARHLGDVFLLITQPMMGDDLQAMKKGILEVADIIVVNKMDGDMAASAKTNLTQLLNALSSSDRSETPVLGCSSIEHRGIKEIWDEAESIMNPAFLQERRHLRGSFWMQEKVHQILIPALQERYANVWSEAIQRLALEESNFLNEAYRLVERILDDCGKAK